MASASRASYGAGAFLRAEDFHVAVSFGASSGRLYALLADSSGLDPAAPWPKYQRDGRNSGNIGWQPGEFTCP